MRPGGYDAWELHVRTYLALRVGDVPLQALTASTVKALYAELRASGRARGTTPLAAKTVHNIHRTLSRALRDLVSDRLIAGNPAAGHHHQPESPEMPTWTAEQVRDFLDSVADDPYAALWRPAATTGMRRGELAGLRWRDVDLDASRVAVSQQLAKGAVASPRGPPRREEADA